MGIRKWSRVHSWFGFECINTLRILSRVKDIMYKFINFADIFVMKMKKFLWRCYSSYHPLTLENVTSEVQQNSASPAVNPSWFLTQGVKREENLGKIHPWDMTMTSHSALLLRKLFIKQSFHWFSIFHTCQIWNRVCFLCSSNRKQPLIERDFWKCQHL